MTPSDFEAHKAAVAIVPPIDEIEQRAKAAMPGPWTSGEYGGDPGLLIVWDAEDVEVATVTTDGGLEHEKASGVADFIAHAREDVPALVTYVRELEDQRAHFMAEATRAREERDARALERDEFLVKAGRLTVALANLLASVTDSASKGWNPERMALAMDAAKAALEGAQ